MPRILLVDDDIAEISAVKRVLTRAGHQPVLATNASDAMTSIQQSPPDLLLVGSTCENGEALALARRLGDDGQADLPMLVLGVVADAPPRASQLPRPVDPEQLGERVAELLASVIGQAPKAPAQGAAPEPRPGAGRPANAAVRPAQANAGPQGKPSAAARPNAKPTATVTSTPTATATATATSTPTATATATSTPTATSTSTSTSTPTSTATRRPATAPGAVARPAAKNPASHAPAPAADPASARRAAAEALRARAAELRKPEAAAPAPAAASASMILPPPAAAAAPSEVELASDGLEALLRRAEEAERRHAAERTARTRQADRAAVEAVQRVEAEKIAVQKAAAARDAEQRARAEGEARRRAEGEARQAEEERRAIEGRQREAEEAARREAEEEARRAEQAEERARAEGEARLRAEAERRAAEAERRAAEASARRASEEEARRAEEAEARARAEAEARRALEEELARLRSELESERRSADEKVAQVMERAAAEEQAAEELRRLAEEDARRRAEAELRAREEEEEQLRAAIASARAEMEALRRRGEQEARDREDSEAELRFAEEESRRRAEAEAGRRRAAEEEARRRAEAEAELRRVAEDEGRRRAEAEAELRRVAEEAARRAAAPPAFDFPGLGPPAPEPDAPPAPSPGEEDARRRAAVLRDPGPAPAGPPIAVAAERDVPARRLRPPPPELRSGTLEDLPAPRLLALAARVSLDGRIDVQGEGARSIYFEDGRVSGATSADPSERVEEVALRLGLVTRDQHRQIAAAAATLPSRRAAMLLLERGFLKPTELTGLARRRTEEIVFGLFADAAARFRWAGAEVPSEERTVLERPTLALAVEGVRRRWLAPRVEAVLGGAGTLLVPAPAPPPAEDLGLSVAERRIAALADGLRTLDEIVTASPLDALSTRQVLAALVLVGTLAVRLHQGGRQAGPAAEAIDLARVREKHDQVRRADYFTILGVGRLCTPHEVRAAAERLLADLEPARFRDAREDGLAERLDEIRRVVADAREVLADDRLRGEYLRGIGGGEA